MPTTHLYVCNVHLQLLQRLSANDVLLSQQNKQTPAKHGTALAKSTYMLVHSTRHYKTCLQNHTNTQTNMWKTIPAFTIAARKETKVTHAIQNNDIAMAR